METPIVAVARAMHERRSRLVVVGDRRGSPLGVLTGFDLLSLYDGDAETPGGTVAELMHPPITIGPDATLREAADQMLEQVYRLVVVDPEDPARIPLGLISTSGIVAEMAAPDSVWQA